MFVGNLTPDVVDGHAHYLVLRVDDVGDDAWIVIDHDRADGGVGAARPSRHLRRQPPRSSDDGSRRDPSPCGRPQALHYRVEDL